MENSNASYSIYDLELGDEFQKVDGRQKRAFNNLTKWHRECRDMLNLYNSWENRRRYTYHNNIDVPLAYKVVESTVPYLSGGDLEPGCIALSPEDKDSAWRMNQQLKYFCSTRAAKKAFAEATRWKVITGVGFIKDGWNIKQDFHRRWIKDDQELVAIASKSDIPELKAIADRMLTEERLNALHAEYEQYQDRVMDLLQQGVPEGSIPSVEPPPSSEEDIKAFNKSVLDEIKAFVSKKSKDGTPVCPNIIPQGNGYVTLDVDEFKAPALVAVPTYDIAWLGSGQDIQAYEAIYHRYYVTRHQLKRILKQQKANEASGWVNLEYVIDHAPVRNTSSEMLEDEYKREMPVPNSIELIEETRRKSNGRIVVTTIAPGASCVVRQTESPFFHNQFNFTRLVTYPSVSDLKGFSVLRPIESLCAAVIKQMNSLLDNSDLVQNPAFIASKGAQMTDRQLSLYAGKIITARVGDLQPLTIPDVRGATQNIVNYLMSMIFSMSGCAEVLDGVVPFMGNGKGAPDLDALRFSTTARLRYQLNSDSISLSGLMERMCSNVMQFNREPRKIPVVLDGKAAYIDYEPASDTGAFRFFTDASSMVAPDPAVLRAQLTGLLNMIDNITIAHKDEASGQYVQRLLGSKQYIFKRYADACCVGNPELFLVSPDSDEAIPSHQLPVMPVPPQPEPQQRQPPQGGQNPEDAGLPPQAQMGQETGQISEGQPSIEKMAMQIMQMPQEQQAQTLSQLPPEIAEQVMAFIEQSMQMQGQEQMPLDTGGSVTPQEAMAINTGDFSGGQGVGSGRGFSTASGSSGMPPMLGGSQQMGSGRIISPEQMAQGSNISDIKQSATNLQ